MDNIKKFQEWRAEEIVKVFLLKADLKLSIDKYPTPLFDFFVTIKDKPNIKFAVEVKTTKSFQLNLKKQLSNIKTYRDADMITIPVLIFRIDEQKETGELDFLVIPSFKENKLLIRNEFQFVEMRTDNLKDKIDSITKWHERK
jgi:hypothetical protein